MSSVSSARERSLWMSSGPVLTDMFVCQIPVDSFSKRRCPRSFILSLSLSLSINISTNFYRFAGRPQGVQRAYIRVIVWEKVDWVERRDGSGDYYYNLQ